MDGIISETAGVVLGGAGFYWNDRFLRNEFGGMIYETIIEPIIPVKACASQYNAGSFRDNAVHAVSWLRFSDFIAFERYHEAGINSLSVQ